MKLILNNPKYVPQQKNTKPSISIGPANGHKFVIHRIDSIMGIKKLVILKTKYITGVTIDSNIRSRRYQSGKSIGPIKKGLNENPDTT